MSAYLRIGHFVATSNQALINNESKALIAHPNSLGVSSVNLQECAEQKTLNRQTWRLFRESVQETISREKYDWICNRYHSRYDFMKLERNGECLRPEHVEAFASGASQLLS